MKPWNFRRRRLQNTLAPLEKTSCSDRAAFLDSMIFFPAGASPSPALTGHERQNVRREAGQGVLPGRRRKGGGNGCFQRKLWMPKTSR